VIRPAPNQKELAPVCLPAPVEKKLAPPVIWPLSDEDEPPCPCRPLGRRSWTRMFCQHLMDPCWPLMISCQQLMNSCGPPNDFWPAVDGCLPAPDDVLPAADGFLLAPVHYLPVLNDFLPTSCWSWMSSCWYLMTDQEGVLGQVVYVFQGQELAKKWRKTDWDIQVYDLVLMKNENTAAGVDYQQGWSRLFSHEVCGDQVQEPVGPGLQDDHPVHPEAGGPGPRISSL
jgi:hypothetical protein